MRQAVVLHLRRVRVHRGEIKHPLWEELSMRTGKD